MILDRCDLYGVGRSLFACGAACAVILCSTYGKADDTTELLVRYETAVAELTAAITEYELLTTELDMQKQQVQAAIEDARVARQTYSEAPSSDSRRRLQAALATEEQVLAIRTTIAQDRDQALLAVEDARATVAAAGIALDRAGIVRPRD